MGTRHGGSREIIRLGRRLVACFAIALLTLTTASCAKPTQPTELISEPTPQPNRLIGQMAEVSPPETLESLKQIIDAYTPQVRILSPRPGEVIQSTTATVRLQVRGLPLFKSETWQLGPHLHIFLDDQPYQAVYDPSEPIVFEGLAPGTHTLRVFASRPWHESFKNQGAFDQRTFHIYAQTPQNEVNAKAPLLTYSRPQGTYGAEPIMLDFYLTNAPLHISAQVETNDDLHDWRIRCTVNDQSFVFDQWQPIWLKGFKPGRNWVQLELIDENGTPIDNRFNNTVRVIDYQPGGTDTLSRLVRGELDLKTVAGIIDPTYLPPAPPEPESNAATGSPELDRPEPNTPELAPPSAPKVTPPITPGSPSAPTPTEPDDPELAPADLAPSETDEADIPVPTIDQPQALDEQDQRSAPAVNDQTPDLPTALNQDLDHPKELPPGVLLPEEQSPEETGPEDLGDVELAPQDLPTDSGAEQPTASNRFTEDPWEDPLVNIPAAQDPVIKNPSATDPTSKGLVDRFKQWRRPTPPSPNEDWFIDPPPVTPDLFAEPAPELAEEPTPNLPPAESPAELSPEAPESADPERSTPRSPLPPEERPFI
jgi:hypothetical protein